jgi:hypothetical protein
MVQVEPALVAVALVVAPRVALAQAQRPERLWQQPKALAVGAQPSLMVQVAPALAAA